MGLRNGAAKRNRAEHRAADAPRPRRALVVHRQNHIVFRFQLNRQVLRQFFRIFKVNNLEPILRVHPLNPRPKAGQHAGRRERRYTDADNLCASAHRLFGPFLGFLRVGYHHLRIVIIGFSGFRQD